MKQRIRPMFSAQKRMNSERTTLEFLIYEDIGENWWTGGGITAKIIAAAIQQAGVFDRISVRVNSPGGDCFEGVAIYNLLRAQGKPIDVYVDGLAASAASVIAMAGDTIAVGLGAMIMIHNASTFAYGDGNELRKMADTLDKISETVGTIYVEKTKQTAEEIKALMDAETWMGAQEAIDKGFASKMLDQDEKSAADAQALAGGFNLRHCRHVPEKLKSARVKNGMGECECDCQPCMDGDCANCSNVDCTDPNCMDCPNQEPIGSQAPPDAFDDIARQRLALYEKS